MDGFGYRPLQVCIQSLLTGVRSARRKFCRVRVSGCTGFEHLAPEEVAKDIRKALKYVNVENLLVTSDCGFGRQGANRLVAFYKSAAASQGANIVRREYGLSETYVPCADPYLIQDVVLTAFEDGAQLSPERIAQSAASTNGQRLAQPRPIASPTPARYGSATAQRFSDFLKR